MEANRFTKVQRPTDDVMLHMDAPVYVVHYPATYARAEHWQAYRAVAHLPRGRFPWTVDNRKLSQDGFPTLEAALQAADEFAQKFSQRSAA